MALGLARDVQMLPKTADQYRLRGGAGRVAGVAPVHTAGEPEPLLTEA